ncbi:SWIM zinc finger family protein [Bacillaceae bacterium Marseille-Q3522]|nr:SWIM zinc finger family protein [Bacillaceae bacterium Marseille-Q3522]
MLNPEIVKDRQVVQKGLLLFRQGLVSSLQRNNRLVTATVQDVTKAKVYLDLDDYSQWACTCQASGYCRHQMAVFFKILSQTGSVSEWIDKWKKAEKINKITADLGLRRASDLLKEMEEKNPETEFDRWIPTFIRNFRSVMLEKGKPEIYQIPYRFSEYYRIVKAGAPLRKDWKDIYFAIGSIYSFSLLLQLSRELQHGVMDMEYYYSHVFQHLHDEIRQRLEGFANHPLPFAFDSCIERMRKDAKILLEKDLSCQFERIDLYRLLWTSFFRNNEWRQSEYTRLKKIENPSFDEQTAMVHLLLLMREDEAAVRQLKEIHYLVAPYFLFWLNSMTNQKDWKRLEIFIPEFIQKLRPFLANSSNHQLARQVTDLALEAITPYTRATHSPDLLEKALNEMLPYSYHYYSDFLFSSGAYQKWSVLHAYMDIDISYLPKEQIQEIQKQDPVVLLPLYHQTIHKKISLKQREHYKEAVKLLKKLRTIYKKQKRLEEWDHFMDELERNTKRLRAFQEECKRSKLIHA